MSGFETDTQDAQQPSHESEQSYQGQTDVEESSNDNEGDNYGYSHSSAG